MKRCFIVGCPRSGNTLLHALLAAHSKVITFRESAFFIKSYRGCRAFLLRGFHASAVLRSWLQQIGMQEYVSCVPRLSPFRNPVVKAFLSIMDELALREGASCWVEKTPGHIFVIEEIEKRIPDSLFIHIIRDGRAVVASLWDVHRRYPQVWRSSSLAECVEKWNKAIVKSTECVGKKNHYFLSYEALTANRKAELAALCRFLGLEFEEAMLTNYRASAPKIMGSESHWVKNVLNPIQPRGLDKYHRILSDKERGYVERHLIEIPEALRRAMRHE